MGDRELLHVALSNLVSNAIRYSNSGTLTVKAHVVAALAEIGVSDDGCGIPSSEFGRIFEPSYRVGQPQRGTQTGIGLGLAISMQIVEDHGGTIHVQSEVGKGSTFSIVLPLARPGSGLDDRVDRSPPPHRPRKA